jgi:hypothetical protein
MKVQIDTLHLREMVYEMFRNLEDGEYIGNSDICRGMLDTERTAALDDLIDKIEKLAA